MHTNRWLKTGRRVAPLVLVLALLATLAGTPMATAQDSAMELGELELLWEAGGPAPENAGTMTMAIHPITGDIWVAVAHDNQFWIMSPEGEYKETWGETGSGPGQFRFATPTQLVPWASGAIAFAPDGSFYVGDLGNYRVQHFDPERRYVGEWGSFGKGDGQFSQLITLSTDGETVFAGDGDRWDIQAFGMDGTFLRSFDGGMAFVDPAVLDAEGFLHVTNVENTKGAPSRYAVLDQHGEVLRSVDLSGFAPGALPWAVAVRPDGTAYVSMLRMTEGRDEYLGIVEIDPDGQIVRAWQGGGDRLLLSPEGDALYVARGVSLPREDVWSFIRKYALPNDGVAEAAEVAGAAPATIDGTFNVDGHDLYLRCEGTGSPTVVYLHGSIPSRERVPMPHANGLFAMDALAADVRVCVFDRRNVGRSETVDAPQSPDDIMADMRGLLEAASVEPPYVLLGASFGGLLAYLYANQHPDEVVGMVLLDSMFPDEMSLEDMFPYEDRFEASDVEDETEGFERISHYKVMQAVQPYIGREPAIPVTFLNSLQEGHHVNDFGMPEYDERVIELQRAYVERFSPGRYLRVDSPHFMEAAIPDLVVEELRGVIEAAGD